MAKDKEEKIKEITIKGEKIKVSKKISDQIDELKKDGYEIIKNNSPTHADKNAIRILRCSSGMMPDGKTPRTKYCIWAVKK